MKCRDFETLWDKRFDARDDPPGLVDALEAHAASCEKCRPILIRNQTLQRAIRAWGPPPAVSGGFVDRVLAAVPVVPRDRSRRFVRFSLPIGLAAAAAVLLAVWIGPRVGSPRRERPADVPLAGATPTSRPLSTALAEATAATWDLARATSAPAAQLGREALASAPLPVGPNALVPTDPRPTTAEVLKTVGHEVRRGVEPLSGTARNAFGFLLGPAFRGQGDAESGPGRGV